MMLKLVTIATFQETATAGLAQSQLQSAGINAYLADAEILNTDWLLNNALGGIKLQVANDDEQRARELLAIDTDPAAQAAQEKELITLAGDDRDDEPETPLNERELLAERIFRGAIASILFPPLAFAIIWYAVGYYRSNEPVNSQASSKAFWGTLIASPWPLMVLVFAILFVIYVISGG
jgi:hypothetical protein